ncbi:MAG: IS110 family transposase [Rhodopila sp.]
MPSENTIRIAIELSVSSWLVAAQLPGGEKSRLYRIEGGDTATLLARIDELRSQVARKSRQTVEVACCFEAGRDGFWLHRWLTANGVLAHVLEPTSILVNRRARRAKTDRLDAEGMLRVLAAWQAGDRQVCSMVRVPTPEEEDAKRPHREREHLVRERQRIENRIEALLFTQGIRGRPSLRSWERDMAALRTGDGRAVPPLMQAELNRLRRQLVQILELICEVEAERADAQAAAVDEAATRKIMALQRVRGIGTNFAAVLVHEVFYRSFANRRQLGSYVGIAPMPYQSGGMDRDRSISRAGNPRARTTLIQLAWLWLRYQPDSALAKWFRERVGALQGRTRRIAILAMARKLLIALWRYVETGVMPDGVQLSPAAEAAA